MYFFSYRVVFLFVCCWCVECNIHGNKSSYIHHRTNDWKETIMSINTSWSSERDRERSTDFWKCIHDANCTIHVNANRQTNGVCVCTKSHDSNMCATTLCQKGDHSNFKKFDCKYNLESENASQCPDSDEFSPSNQIQIKPTWMKAGATGERLTCSLSKEECLSKDEADIHIKKITIQKTSITLKLLYLDLLTNCSANRSSHVFMIRQKTSIFMCLFLHCKNFCTELSCKTTPYLKTNDQRVSDKEEPSRISFTKIWSQLKVEILLLCSGVAFIGGVIGFTFGWSSYKVRKRKYNLTRAKITQPRCYVSQDYAEISETIYAVHEEMDENTDNDTNQTGLDYKKGTIDIKGFNRGLIPSSEDYSNIYNVLQINYGPKRNSLPTVHSDSEGNYNLCLRKSRSFETRL